MKKKKQVNKQKNVLLQKLDISTKKYLFFSFLIIIFFTLIFSGMYFCFPTYKNVFLDKIYKNTRFIFKNKNVTLEQKYKIRMGKDYQFLRVIKKRTPEDAIILFPPKEFFKNTEFNQKGSWGLKDPTWATYFLYPRIVINEKWEKDFPEIYNKYTHVFLMNEWGYDKLEYPVPINTEKLILPRVKGGKK